MKVLLVDGFPMVRAALTGLIEQHFAGAQVQGVDTVDAARQSLAQALPRLVLLDLRVPGGFEHMVHCGLFHFDPDYAFAMVHRTKLLSTLRGGPGTRRDRQPHDAHKGHTR